MPEPAAADPIVQLCAFRVGDEDYVIDLRRVREIIPPLRITPVPRAPQFIEGVVNLRGEIIPMIDVRKRFGLPPQPQTRRTKFLVVTVAARILGLVVDGVSEVLRIPRSAIRGAPGLADLDVPKLFLGVCDAQPGAARGGKDAARSARAATPGAPSPARGHIRLLLNVKALLDPIEPGELVAARELAAGAGEG